MYALRGPEVYKEGLQSVLSKTRPTRHPKSGTYLVRMVIPGHLRDTAMRLYGVSRELRENLHTKDATIARQRAPEAVARLRGKIERAARVASEVLSEPLTREVAALVGDWYRREIGAAYDDPANQELHVDILMELAANPECGQELPEVVLVQIAQGLLHDHDYAVTDASVGRVLAAPRRGFQDYHIYVGGHLRGAFAAAAVACAIVSISYDGAAALGVAVVVIVGTTTKAATFGRICLAFALAGGFGWLSDQLARRQRQGVGLVAYCVAIVTLVIFLGIWFAACRIRQRPSRSCCSSASSP